MKQVANFITLLNLVFGCIAIVFTLQTGETIVNLENGEWKILGIPWPMYSCDEVKS